MSRGFKQTKPRNLLCGGDGGIKREVKAELGLKIRSAVGEQLDLGCGGGLRRRSGCRANGGASGARR